MTGVDIHAFNLARLAEDEAVALDAIHEVTDGHWTYRPPTAHPHGAYKVTDSLGYSLTEGYDVESDPWWTCEHIARHDPARVLREVAAKRRVLERHRPASHPNYRFYDTDPIVYTCVGCGYDTNSCGEHEPRAEDINDCPELRDIAAIYADHEDYAPKWSETP